GMAHLSEPVPDESRTRSPVVVGVHPEALFPVVPLGTTADVLRNEADRHRRQDVEPGAGRAEQPRPMRSTVEVRVESGISDDEAAMIVDEELFLDETQPAEEAGGRRYLIERRPLSSELDLRDMRSSAPREARFAAANVA